MSDTAKRLNIVPCPNPYCDSEDGCCVCEHTGRVYQFVVDAMTVEAEPQPETAERAS